MLLNLYFCTKLNIKLCSSPLLRVLFSRKQIIGLRLGMKDMLSLVKWLVNSPMKKALLLVYLACPDMTNKLCNSFKKIWKPFYLYSFRCNENMLKVNYSVCFSLRKTHFVYPIEIKIKDTTNRSYLIIDRLISSFLLWRSWPEVILAYITWLIVQFLQ